MKYLIVSFLLLLIVSAADSQPRRKNPRWLEFHPCILDSLSNDSTWLLYNGSASEYGDVVDSTKLGVRYIIFRGSQVNEDGFKVFRREYGQYGYELRLFYKGYPVYYKYIWNGKTVAYERNIKIIKHFNLLF